MEVQGPSLHPMNLSEILDATFALYRRNFVLFAGVVAVLAIPQAIINFALTSSVANTKFVTQTGTQVSVNSGALKSLFGLSTGTSVISLIFLVLVTGALAQAISARYLGRALTVKQAYQSLSLGTVASLLFGSILYGIFVLVGLAIVIIPGIYMAVLFLFLSQSIVLERTGIWGGLGRSSELVRGSWWRVFGIAIVLVILVAVIQGAVGGLAGLLLLSVGGDAGIALRTAITAIAGILVKPIEFGALTLLYYDLRIRKEGFDLQRMAQSLDAAGPI